MTSRLNVKVLLIVLGTLAVGAGVVAALLYLQIRTNPERNVRMGDEAMKAGDLELAISSYGRAVSKEPANLEYLDLLEQALLKIRPKTVEEARDRYGMRLRLLQQEAEHYPTNPDAHLELIDELFNNARLLETTLGSRNGWRDVHEAAQTMWENVPESDEKRIEAKLYKGMAALRQVGRLTDAEVASGEQDLEAYLQQRPDNELGWAALVRGRMLLADHIQQTGTQGQAQAKWAQVKDDLDRAMESTPDGPHVAHARALYYTWQRFRYNSPIPQETLHDALQRFIDLSRPADDPWLVIDAAKVLRYAPRFDGPQKAVDLLREHLEKNPDAHPHRLILARMHLATNEFENARASAQKVINAQPPTLSFLSQMHFGLRRFAASVVVDVEFERWRSAEQDEQKHKRLEQIKVAVEQLRDLSGDSDSVIDLAEAKVAFASGEYSKAATRLENLIAQGLRDFDTHRLAAIALKNVDQPGLAYDHVMAALNQRPTHLGMLHEKAALELQMQRPDDAAQTIEQALEHYPGNAALEALASQVERQRAEETFELENPDVRRLAQAQRQLDAGDIEAARATLEEAVEQSRYRLRFLIALVRLEMSAGNQEQAKQYLQQALELDPSNRVLQRLSMMLEYDDPVEALQQYLANAPGDKGSQAVEAAINMGQLARSREQLAASLEQNGQHEQAEAAREIARRARTHEQQALEQAEELAPDDPRLIEYQFNKALRQENWQSAEQLAQRAGDVNADQAGGLIYRGRIALAQKNWEQAARTLQDAVDRNSVLSEAWHGLAVAYQNLGNYSEAVRAYDEAYRRNPAANDVVKAYCALLQQTGDIPRALRIARESRGLAKRDIEFREMWLGFEADRGDQALALRQRREIYKTTPSDTSNARALVSLLIDLEPQRSLLLDEQGEPRFSPSRWGRMNESTQQQHLQQAVNSWHNEAERILDELEQDGERTIDLAMLRARLLRARGNPQQGEAVLQQFIESQPSGPDKARMMMSLAEFQRQSNRQDAAVQTLEQAIAYQGEDRPVDAALGSMYFSRGEFEEALEHFERCIEVTSNRSVELRTVECMIRLKRFDQAERRLEAIKSNRGNDFMASLLEASILKSRAEHLYEQGDVDAAEVKMQENKAVLNVARQINPRSPMPDIQRANALLAQYQHTGDQQLLDEALSAVDRADSVQANNRQASVLRIRILRAKGDTQRLISELTRLVESNPDDQQFRQMLVQTHVERGQYQAAIQVARQGTQRDPAEAAWYGILGELYMQSEGNRSEAMEAFLRAYEIAGVPNAIRQYMTLANSQPLPPGSHDFSRALRAVSQNRQQVENNPVMRALVAQMLYVQEQRTSALQQLQIAYQQTDNHISQGGDIQSLRQWIMVARRIFRHEDVQIAERNLRNLFGDDARSRELQLIAGLWTSAGSPGYDRAEQVLREALEKADPDADPRLVGELHRDLGTILHEQGEHDQAVQSYEQAKQYIEEDPYLLNNLAYILTEHLNDPGQALAYAERAAELLPDNALVLDTLGWAQYKTGQVEPAEQSLRASLAQQATAGTHLRLARLLVDTNRTEEAMSHLRQAEQLNPDSATQTEIDRLLDDIRTKASADR